MDPKDKPINQHKRLAMGDTVRGYAKGGMVGMPPSTPKVAVVVAPTKQGLPASPMTVAKRDNGVPGMKKGGAAKKSKKSK